MPAPHPTWPGRALLTGLLLGGAAVAGAAYPNYYPSTPGTRLTYSSGESQLIGSPVTHRGVRVTPISHQFGSTTYSQDLMEFRADGSVWMRGVITGNRLSWFTAPLNVYPPGPLTPGMRWTSAGGNLKTSSTVLGLATVRQYNALTISTETNAGGKVSTQLTYFVPSVGVVRYQTADGSVIDLQQ